MCGTGTTRRGCASWQAIQAASLAWPSAAMGAYWPSRHRTLTNWGTGIIHATRFLSGRCPMPTWLPSLDNRDEPACRLPSVSRHGCDHNLATSLFVSSPRIRGGVEKRRGCFVSPLHGLYALHSWHTWRFAMQICATFGGLPSFPIASDSFRCALAWEPKQQEAHAFPGHQLGE